jgi:hypothetical protein
MSEALKNTNVQYHYLGCKGLTKVLEITHCVRILRIRSWIWSHFNGNRENLDLILNLGFSYCIYNYQELVNTKKRMANVSNAHSI